MVILYLHHTVWDIRNMKMQLNLEDKTYCQNKGWSCLANGKRLCCDNEFCILYFLYFFRWGTHLSMSLFPSVRLSVCPSIRRTSYLRNRTSSNRNFWYTSEMMISPGSFVSFFKFSFLGLKLLRMKNNNYISHTISKDQSSIWSWFLAHVCKIMISPGVSFILLKFLLFGLWGG